MSQRITIDPVTRIEGHLRIDCEIENGVVSKAWASGTMWRGMEEIVKNRDPRDAWMIVQRICGVCTTTHAISSVRAAESALNIDVPVNAQYIRNIILAAHTTHDHIVHFYQLCAGLGGHYLCAESRSGKSFCDAGWRVELAPEQRARVHESSEQDQGSCR